MKSFRKIEVEYSFIQIKNVPPEVIEEAAFISRGEVLSLEEGYIFYEKHFEDLQNLRYYFTGSYPDISIMVSADPTVDYFLHNYLYKIHSRNPLEMLDGDWLIPQLIADYTPQSQGQLLKKVVQLPGRYEKAKYGLNDKDFKTILEWLGELGWAESVPLRSIEGMPRSRWEELTEWSRAYAPIFLPPTPREHPTDIILTERQGECQIRASDWTNSEADPIGDVMRMRDSIRAANGFLQSRPIFIDMAGADIEFSTNPDGSILHITFTPPVALDRIEIDVSNISSELREEDSNEH